MTIALIGLLGGLIGASVGLAGQWLNARWSAQAEAARQRVEADDALWQRRHQLIQEAMSASARFELELGRISFRLLEFRRRMEMEPENRRTLVPAEIYRELASSDVWDASSACSATSGAAMSAFAVERRYQDLGGAVVEALDQLRWAAFVDPVRLEALTGNTIWKKVEAESQEAALRWMRSVAESRDELAFKVADLEIAARGLRQRGTHREDDEPKPGRR